MSTLQEVIDSIQKDIRELKSYVDIYKIREYYVLGYDASHSSYTNSKPMMTATCLLRVTVIAPSIRPISNDLSTPSEIDIAPGQ